MVLNGVYALTYAIAPNQTKRADKKNKWGVPHWGKGKFGLVFSGLSGPPTVITEYENKIRLFNQTSLLS